VRVASETGVSSLDPPSIVGLPVSVSCGHRPLVAFSVKAQVTKTRDIPAPRVAVFTSQNTSVAVTSPC